MKEGFRMLRFELIFDRLLRMALCGLLAVALTHAQGNRGSITGTITDSSGAAVADVEVAVTNIGTGEITGTRSNDSGIYSALNLAPARYSLKFTRQGFKPIDVPSFTLLS